MYGCAHVRMYDCEDEKRALHNARPFFHKRCISNYRVFYFLLHSLGVTQVPVALQTTIGSSRKSAAEALMSGLACRPFLASKEIVLEVVPMIVFAP